MAMRQPARSAGGVDGIETDRTGCACGECGCAGLPSPPPPSTTHSPQSLHPPHSPHISTPSPPAARHSQGHGPPQPLSLGQRQRLHGQVPEPRQRGQRRQVSVSRPVAAKRLSCTKSGGGGHQAGRISDTESQGDKPKRYTHTSEIRLHLSCGPTHSRSTSRGALGLSAGPDPKPARCPASRQWMRRPAGRGGAMWGGDRSETSSAILQLKRWAGLGGR